MHNIHELYANEFKSRYHCSRIELLFRMASTVLKDLIIFVLIKLMVLVPDCLRDSAQRYIYFIAELMHKMFNLQYQHQRIRMAHNKFRGT